MIGSFKDEGTEDLFNGAETKAARRVCPPGLWRSARRKLALLNAAGALHDLRVPPGNHLEQLVGDRSGQYSIRLNDRYRICFRWTDRGPEDVEIVDYH